MKDKSKYAFPRDTGCSGMTLRQYYAGQVLIGELSSQSPETGEWTDTCLPQLAERCFKIADAMVEEGKK